MLEKGGYLILDQIEVSRVASRALIQDYVARWITDDVHPTLKETWSFQSLDSLTRISAVWP